MRKNIQSFRGKLDDLGEVEVSHSAEKIEDMEAKMFELQQNHDRVMNWADTNRHKSAAWKDAIEKNLKKLGREIVSEDSTLQGERLDSETSLSNGIHNVWGNLQSELSETDNEDSRMYQHAAAGFGKGVADLTKHTELNAYELYQAYKGGQEAMRQKEQAGLNARKGIAYGAHLLDKTLVNLAKETEDSRGVLANMKLPLLVSTDANQNITKRYNDMQSILNERLASSLLQEKENARSVTHLRNAETRKAEIRAIKKLNAMLYQQGNKLAHQNSFLEEGLSYVKGLPVPQPLPLPQSHPQ
jgi:hypothetical protein